MKFGSRRSAAAALVIAALLMVTAPASAEAGTFDLAERLSSRVERLVDQGQDLLSFIWHRMGGFVASAGATMCGDG